MGLSKIVQYGFLLLVFLLPWQAIFLLREPFIDGEKWQYGTIGVYGADVLLLVIFGLVIVQWLESIKYRVSRITYGATEIALMLLVVWSGISILWASDSLLATYFFLKLLFGAGVFLVARSLDVSVIKKVIFALLLAGVLQSGIGMAQFLSQQSGSSVLLGMSVHEASQAGSSVLKIDGERFLRAYGTFPHPNILGGFLAAVLILSLRYGAFVNSRISRITYLSSLTIVLLGLILTFSRTAWLGAGLGMAVLFILNFLSNDTRKLRPWFSGVYAKILGVLAVAGVVFVAVLHEQVFPRFDLVTIEREGSVSERVQSLRDASVVFGEGNILLGTGVGNFTVEMMRLAPGRPVWSIQPAHNVFVLVVAELGLMGCIFFGAFLWSTLRNMKKKNVIFIIALLTLLPSLFLDHFLWTSHFGILFFFLLLGLAQSKNEK